MPISERAKQFSPFSPLRGLERALAEKEKIREERRELSESRIEEIDLILSKLQNGDIITVVYYEETERMYLQLTGAMQKADVLERKLWLGTREIRFCDIYEIIPAATDNADLSADKTGND